MTYLALLRGINVGGNNIIKMVDLRNCFTDNGYKDVSTYIQSGNVVFTTNIKSTVELEKSIEKMLNERFNYNGVAIVLSVAELRKVINEAPKGFGSQPDKYRYDVMFIKRPHKVKVLAAEIPTRDRVDMLWEGPKVIYFSRLIAKATQSRMSRIVGLSIYQHLSIRNWNTTNKLNEMIVKT